ncbi:DUF1254 domain-containing protein [Arthrobacter sp. GMC3]|uniref:DUF1254 domain-containing protein n=1 Tax=Arthrobacter sp. GMC3 TaxID=2058894 RepID=UPI000CE3754B|nr:DUF1254 domain-containing protein [Arthrobacter sp. GMC3]
MSTATTTEIQEITQQAYSYLYPLVIMDITRLQFQDLSNGPQIGRGPQNTFTHVEEFPPADFRGVVAPNFDTLYSVVWLDLSKGPVIIHMPDTNGRYYLLPVLDMWTDVFAVPGKRTTGTGEGDFLVATPGWDGEVPDEVTVLNAPTSTVWIIGRTQTNGPADYDAVRAVQRGITLRTLEGGAPSTIAPPSVAPEDLNLTIAPLDIVNGLSAVDFFTYAARLMKNYPPHPTDFSILAQIRRIGLIPGEDFDVSDFDAEGIDALEAGAKAALAHQLAIFPTVAKIVNGWSMNTDTMGVYGNFYLKRAIVAMIGLGANPPEDAVYPVAVTDADGNPLVGETDYVLHFDADQLPPVSAFWSVTMYDNDSFQVANEIDRFALGDRDDLTYNDDGSLDLYFQKSNPGPDRLANWLPSASGPLRVIMRLYGPAPHALDGRWAPPAIHTT